jgi:Cu2+-exporting ATPase
LAELKPADKIAWLDARACEGRKVLMVGERLNDAPALAAAHASMSPPSAADISQRAADFVFTEKNWRLSSKPSPRASARVSWRCRILPWRWFTILCVPLAMAGFVTPLIAAIVMSTSSILVTANAARLAGRGRS